jgi:hypothetical protein
LTLSTQVTDIFGNVSTASSNYSFVAGADQIYAIQTNNNSAAVATLSPLAQ